MQRRTFLQVSAGIVAADAKALAQAPMPMRRLGKTDMTVSRFTLGGYHYVRSGEEEAIRIVHRAIDLGVNFFDCAHLYNKGLSDTMYGKALEGGLRKKVFLMSKAEIRDRAGAMRQLEETLQRMKTDYLDLWQCHQVVTGEEVDQILAPGGALEAFVEAKKQGKARYIGFTGHRDPAVLARLLAGFDGWDAVQHPVNLIDPHYLSFIQGLLPKAAGIGIGRIGMKSNAIGNITKNNVATIPECLRFAWSQDIDTLVSGVETVKQLDENVAVLKSFRPMSGREIESLLSRTRQGPHGQKVEQYKLAPKTGGLPPHRDGEPV
jgi:aryl-alcohol dehydrogenase-like predicted oxidoreductase